MLELAHSWLDAYFFGAQSLIDHLPLAPAGSEFRRMIWQYLCEIPYGQLTSYGSLARRAAVASGKAKMSAQAVGGAVGHNPISLFIPCHRVIGADGRLVGYTGGLDLKRALLAHEGVRIEGDRVVNQAIC